jgi:TonB family protein
MVIVADYPRTRVAAASSAAATRGFITLTSVPPPDLQNQLVKPVPSEKLPLPPPPRIRRLDMPTLIVETPPKIWYLPPLPLETPTSVRRVGGGPGAGFPDTADFYPSLPIHLGEEGMSTVRVCVDPNGKLTSNPTTVKSSGSARLDEGALKLARAGSGHYRATTEDGQPVHSCYPLGIRFQLKK